METVGVLHPFNTERFLAVLNQASGFAAERKDWAQRRKNLIFAEPELYESAEQQLELLVRQYADEWIATGTNPDGLDSPRDRNVDALAWKGELGAPPNAYRAANFFLKKNPPEAHITRDGSLYITLPLEAFPTSGVDDPIKEATEEAARLFAIFLTSDFRFYLSHCCFCGIYYFRKKLRPYFKRGSHCKACRSKQTAIVRVEEKRKAAKQKLFALVARKFARRIQSDHNWRQNRKLKQEIADYLDHKIGCGETCDLGVELSATYPNGVKVNWISLSDNAKEIEIMVAKKLQSGKAHGSLQAR